MEQGQEGGLIIKLLENIKKQTVLGLNVTDVAKNNSSTGLKKKLAKHNIKQHCIITNKMGRLKILIKRCLEALIRIQTKRHCKL